MITIVVFYCLYQPLGLLIIESKVLTVPERLEVFEKTLPGVDTSYVRDGELVQVLKVLEYHFLQFVDAIIVQIDPVV